MEKFIKEFKETLECEKQSFKDGGETDKNIQGWIESLEYVINTLKREL